MDNSQSSDILSETTDIFCNSPTDSMMDTITYDSLISITKVNFSSIHTELRKTSFSSLFSSLLDDCCACVYQSLDLISKTLSDTDVDKDKLKEYIGNAISILQSLSDLTKNIIESISVTCHNMKLFPTSVGLIIKKVFMHCKDSESMYGSYLYNVEVELKDLFRTCNELQLTYLTVLEKHFVFNLIEQQQVDVLIEALDINLQIGELVQSLDVKTMAEQWKAISMICEKYSDYLIDKDVCSESTKILCTMLMKNIGMALEETDDSKLILRSLKVGSFTLKILLRVCTIFKRTVNKEYEQLIELLLLIFMNTDTYLEVIGGKSSQFVKLFNGHISELAQSLLSQLAMDDKFLNYVVSYDAGTFRRDDKLLGYILLIISILKLLLQSESHELKNRVLECVFNFLPLCHVWFNMNLRFQSNAHHTCGLYEHLLIHVTALVVKMDNDGINLLEKRMVQSILSTDCYSAMFSVNLWTLMARICSRQLLLNQVTSLIRMYQKLEHNPMFTYSPQHVHLSFTLRRLFESMTNEDKNKVYNMFRVQEQRNVGVWSVLSYNNLPRELYSVEQFVVEKVKRGMRKIIGCENVDANEMNRIINLGHTICNASSKDQEIEDLVVKAWLKACPKNNRALAETLNKGNVWYHNYIRGLVVITNCMKDICGDDIVQIIHVFSTIIQSGSTELRLLLISPLFALTTQVTIPFQSTLQPILTQTFEELFRDTDSLVKDKLYYELRRHKSSFLDLIVKKTHTLSDDVWALFKTRGVTKSDMDLKENLLSTMDFAYRHKCLENGDDACSIQSESDVTIAKCKSNNFDFVDLDNLFDAENASEPVSKKAKLHSDDVVDEIVSRLEADAHSLFRIKENVISEEYRKRIKKICNKLMSTVDL